MLIGLIDMENTFDDGPLSVIILLGIALLLFDFLLVVGLSMSYW